jgi:hypothetical protein
LYTAEEMGQADNVIDVTATVVNGKEALSGNGNGNGRGLQPATIPPTVAAVPAGTEVWQTWKGPNDAQIWAHKNGYCKSAEHARSSWALVAREVFPGQDSCKPHQLPQLYQAFYEHQVAKDVIKAEKEAADQDIDFGQGVPGGTADDNPFGDSK